MAVRTVTGERGLAALAVEGPGDEVAQGLDAVVIGERIELAADDVGGAARALTRAAPARFIAWILPAWSTSTTPAGIASMIRRRRASLFFSRSFSRETMPTTRYRSMAMRRPGARRSARRGPRVMHSSAAATIDEDGVAPCPTRITHRQGNLPRPDVLDQLLLFLLGQRRVENQHVVVERTLGARAGLGGAGADVEGQLRRGAADLLLQDVRVTKVGGNVKSSHKGRPRHH